MRVDSPAKLALGFGTGMLFGGLLQKGQVGKYEVILDQLLLREGRVLRTMGTAVAVGSVGVHALAQAGYAHLQIKPLKLGSVVPGALLFGTGLAMLGYCPGTTLTALGQGRRDALVGVLGMLAGAAAFVRLYPALEPMVDAGDLGKVTFPTATKTSPWPWVAGLGGVVLAALFAARK